MADSFTLSSPTSGLVLLEIELSTILIFLTGTLVAGKGKCYYKIFALAGSSYCYPLFSGDRVRRRYVS
ncbi:BgTH12-00677 [Blumeria graminis f. sp. triticale]|uniref:BgTH12-00677 n=1 Tax=Blumeria graminis f. sp. triticale TaxID=1689686 RepID=A0A9W4D7C9_BLUGR|nr:BgTH12-00677 [Blumeria graminis f. sp. triticale]